MRSICSRSKKPVPDVPLLEHRDMRHVHQLAVLPRRAEDSLQRRQLAVDLSVGIPPLFTFVALATSITSFCRFRMNAFTSAVVIEASRLPPKVAAGVALPHTRLRA